MATDYNRLNDRVSRLEVEIESIKDDIKDIELIKKTSIEQSTRFEYIVKSLDEIKETVDELKSKPSKFVDYAIMVIIASIIAGVFKVLGI